ncbi:hypothetical protein TSUD_386730 [Trifolium subterraneum]|uniref:SPRY domain-containing protein n=1 Tax=Trifolium subterraneum TaxID=3900 RepID=A0A2Z6MMJ3_TRISU|nr:hypothetical protein TSUD_386730 [Trifolium subterraneum]
MASAKRNFTYEEDDAPIHPKKPKQQLPSPPVLLNSADCDLDFNIESNGAVGYGLNEEGFGYCWSGARATRVDTDDTAIDQRNLCRVGVSRGDDGVGALGETKNSFGFGGTGKFSNSGNFNNFGDRFSVGDTIVCCIDLESKPFGSIGFLKNGKWLGTAFQFDVDSLGLGVVDSHSPWGFALFPHVLLKNVVVQMQFSVEQGLVPREGFKPWALAVADGNAVMGPSLSDPKDCELMMMVALPASGKTTWAEKWVKDHPEKRYVLLGTNLILEQMKVPGLLRKKNYGERFDRLMDKATAMFNVILSRAANVPRNYIIDQTNVYKNARRRKLKPFADYQKIAVVVFPKPEELKRRSEKRFNEMGKEVPADALNNMIANYVLPKSKDMPHSDEYFDQDESQKYLDQMKQDIPPLSNNNPPTLSYRGSSQYSAGSSLQNQGNLTENAGYSQTYNATPTGTGDTGASGNAVLGSQYKANIAGNNMDFHGRPYVEYTNFLPLNYSNYGRPSVEYRDFQPDLHTPVPATCTSLPLYVEPALRPRHGGLPDNLPYSGRYVEPTLIPQHGELPDNMSYTGRYVEPTLRPRHGGLPDNMPYSGRYVEPTVRPQHGELPDNMPYTGRYVEPTPRPRHGGLPDNMPYSGRYASQHPNYYP